jgi:hypothetical protein
MSTSWYKSRIPPKLIQAFLQQTKNHGRLCVEVWETTCIVTNFQQLASVLINPANPSLSGVSKFPYFPKGGPEPKFSPNKDAHPMYAYLCRPQIIITPSQLTDSFFVPTLSHFSEWVM